MKRIMIGVALGIASSTMWAGTIAVKGVGEVKVRPDMVEINFELSAMDKLIKESKAKLREKSATLDKVLRETSVSSNEVTISDVRFNEESHYVDKAGSRVPDVYGRGDATYVFDGYRHSIPVEISFPLDMKRVEKIYTALLDRELLIGARITFHLKDPSAAKKEARRRAIVNAREVALHACEAAGVALGKISMIRCSERKYDMYSVADACCSMADDGTEKAMPTIEVKDITVSDEVDIDWELDQ